MATVASQGWTAIAVGWFAEMAVMPYCVMSWKSVVFPSLAALGVVALAAIVYWLSLPHGWAITTAAVVIAVAVSLSP